MGDYDDKNEFTHLYTLVLKPDNTFEVYFDLKEKAKGSLHDGWDFPKKTADDPSDKRIRDPDAKQPEEWDEEEDGAWEAPMIDNPKFKGEWFAERIDNPAYKGTWVPKQLPNADYVEDIYTYDDIGAVGFELWTVNKGSLFDNILVTDSFEHAKEVAEKVWKPGFEKEQEMKKEKDKAGASSDPPAEGKEDEDDDDDDDAEDA